MAKKKPRKVKGRRGRPPAYKREYAGTAYKLCLLSATDKEMAGFFGVSEQTLNAWKKSQPEFLESITRGKLAADANVAERLYQRAMGYEHDDVYPSSYQGEVTLTPIRKYYPPDTPAASLWLRNRQPAKWRDKIDHEHGGHVDLNLQELVRRAEERTRPLLSETAPPK